VDLRALIAAEANAYFRRNEHKPPHAEAEFQALSSICARAKVDRVLEIGCLDGRMLERISRELGCHVTGIEASQEAVQAASSRYPQIDVRLGVAPFDLEGLTSEASFDVVIVGFFLYLLPRSLLFRTVSAIDAVLSETGYVVLSDFYSPDPIRRKYAHDEQLTTYKMDYATAWTWNPQYKLTSRTTFPDEGASTPLGPVGHNWRTVDVLFKQGPKVSYALVE